MTMARDELIESLGHILMDAVDKFDDDLALDRHLDIAAMDMGRVRRRTLVGEITLVADQPDYDAPANLLSVKCPLWGVDEQKTRKPWACNYPGRLPRLSVYEEGGVRMLWLSPSPSAAQITDLGSTYKFFYFAGHQIGDEEADTTIRAEDRHLLLIRAAAQSMQELAHNGVTKPVQLGNAGVGSMPKNGTPAALAEGLMRTWKDMAA